MRRFWLILMMAATTTLSFAQDDVSKKLSISTQMFLDELNGNITLNRDTKLSRQTGLNGEGESKMINPKYDRIIASPDTVNGKVYISSFIRLDDNTTVSDLEALGVEVQCKFQNGLVTANIPVDKINDVAGISRVKRISVARRMRPLSDKARQATNVDDVLTHSTDAIRAGLPNMYDGAGVLLGVIDTGIDFQHKAFKDKDGNFRIKRAYVYNRSSAREYGDGASYSLSSSSPTTDDSSEDHGTHTSSTAGGSSVIISGSTTTVTDDHASATYGGMAPGADLYLAGVNGLDDTYLANAFQKICNYADQQGKPVVVSNSWGASMGPRDGTGEIAEICNQYFSDSNPNHICLFAASNDAGGGGYHVSGTASSSSPLGTVLNYVSGIQGLSGLYGIIAEAWPRSTGVTLSCKIVVINSSTGAVELEKTVNPSSGGYTSVSLSKTENGTTTTYTSSGSLYVYRDYVSSNKSQIMLYAGNQLMMKSGYKLAVQFYPSSGSSVVDVWASGGYTYFSSATATSGYTWTAGTDDNCVSDEATIPDAISIGAYVTKNSVKDYNNSTHSLTSSYPTVGDIAYFSSYATADQTPTGLFYPWITAPGATIVAGVNAYDTSGDLSYMNGNSANYGMYRVNTDTTNPYGSMEGTSMATPCAAGIVALWLQVAKENGIELTTTDIKNIMKETAITDSYTTTGTNASHFGNGKIDALAGIEYILKNYVNSDPTISVDQEEVAFEGYATKEYTKTVTVTGTNLTGNITVTKSGSNVFTVDKTTIIQTDGAASAELTITWRPTTAGTQTGAITLSSTEAESVTISLTGTAEAATPTIIADKESLEFNALLDKDATQTINVSGRFLTGNITATLTDDNGVFSVDKTSFEATEDGIAVTITFHSAAEGTFAGTLLLTSAGAENVSIALSATTREGGTASDTFLNIAKYETIDEAGWRTALVDNLYKYTRYEDDEVAWLTLPVYGAFVGAKYAMDNSTFGSGHTQMWVESSLSNQNTYGGTSWTESDYFAGSSYYFTNANARAMGINSGTNTDIRTVSFYVTNTTAVKLYGTGRSGTSETYPASLIIYECTMNGDGTLTPAATATKNVTSSSTSSFNIAAEGLDASKIYKVDASVYRGYMYEIGFQTPIEVEKIPTIKAEPTTIAFETIYATTEATQAINVSGKYLQDDITITVNDENGAFSIDRTSIAATDATGGVELTVTFQPSEAGEYNAMITLSSENAEDVVISLTGTAEAATPTIIADKEELTFSANIDTPQSETVTVTGRFLAEDVTATLTDTHNVFSVSLTALSAEEVTSADGVEITVTFNSANEGDFTGTLTLQSEGAEPVTINLSATASDGGTASDPYLNIAKYATIDEAGWRTALVNTLYKYTEYESDEVAWLTLPVYGAFVGAAYSATSSTINSGHPQAWIQTNITNTSNKYQGTTWNSSDKLLGSSEYFTNSTGDGRARVLGYNSRRNYTQETVTFYVTNTTAVKLLGTGQNQANSTYPVTLKVYECTKNADGTLTEGTTAVKSQSNSATSGTFVLSAIDLDASKIYKVEAATYRSYICEIGFQTPLKKTIIGDVDRNGVVNMADVKAIVKIVLGKDTAEDNYDYEAAHVNSDGNITIADITALVNMLLQK